MPTDPTPCEYCGPVCYRGAEHNARVEDNARFDDAEPSPVAPGETQRKDVDFGVEPHSPEEAVIHACGLLDVIKSEWGEAWSEHDQRVRAGLSRIITRKLFNRPSVAPGEEDKPNITGLVTRVTHPKWRTIRGSKVAPGEYERPEPQGQDNRLARIRVIEDEWAAYKKSMHERRVGGQDYAAWLRDKAIAAREERDRVQAALRAIANHSYNDESESAEEIHRIARAALKPVSDRQPEGEKP